MSNKRLGYEFDSVPLQFFFVTYEAPNQTSGGGKVVYSNYSILKEIFPNLIYIGPSGPLVYNTFLMPNKNLLRKLKQKLFFRFGPVGEYFELVKKFVLKKAGSQPTSHRIFFIENTRLGFIGEFVRSYFGNDALVIYSAHNVEIDYMKTNTLNPLKVIAAKANEKKSCITGDVLLTLTMKDLRRLQRLYPESRARLYWVPPCIMSPISIGQIENKFSGKNFYIRALFVGSLAVRQNILAVRWLVEKVLSKLPTEYRDRLQLTVAGSNPSPKLKLFLSKAHVLLRKNLTIEELNRLYSQNDLFFSPVKGGSGCKIKILDALSHGLPVIAFESSLIGYKDTNSYALIANSERDYADAIIQLMNSPSKIKIMSRAAISYVNRYHLYSVRKNLILNILSENINEKWGYNCYEKHER